MKFPATLDKQLQKELLDCSGELLTVVGDTMCTHGFYEGINTTYVLTFNLLSECSRLNYFI